MWTYVSRRGFFVFDSEIQMSCRFVPRRAPVEIFWARPRRRTEVRASSHGGARLGWPAGGDRAPSRPRAVSATMSQCCVCMESTGEKSVVRARRTDGERDSRCVTSVGARAAPVRASSRREMSTDVPSRRTVARQDATRHARPRTRHVHAKAPQRDLTVPSPLSVRRRW